MAFKILGFLFIASCCTVQSQLCASNGLPTVKNVLSSPQVLNTPVIATTVVDNSVSNALANALQLFIVSDLIQSRLGPNCAQNAYLNGLGVVDTIAPIFPGVDIISPCAPVEVVAPCAPVIETLTPNIFGGITETLTPILGAFPETLYQNNYIAETFVPNYYGGWTETVTPVCADVITPNVFTPNIFGGVTEIIAPKPCGSVAPIVPNYFGGFPEVVPPFISSGPGCGANYFVPEVVPPILPNYYGSIPEILTPGNPYRQSCVSEVVSPTFLPKIFGGLPEVVSPIFSPCGELIAPNAFRVPISNEIISTNGPYGPVSAEVLIPPSIPAQLTCNIGYSNSMPCVNFNVEPYEPYSCGYNFPGFYY